MSQEEKHNSMKALLRLCTPSVAKSSGVFPNMILRVSGFVCFYTVGYFSILWMIDMQCDVLFLSHAFLKEKLLAFLKSLESVLIFLFKEIF